MKERLDVLMVERGLAPSREKAKVLIMAGDVFVNGNREDKAGSAFDPEKSEITVKGAALPYVSRGGLKLEKALQVFPIDLNGAICMDIGASTGGFTDCMLQNGAAKVFSIDVGYGQLDWKLRNDDRVVCMEKTNFRHMKPGDLAQVPAFASCDVSFISLTKILIPARNLLMEGGYMVCLIKPQFEAGKDKVGKKGVVRDGAVHLEVVKRICDFADMIGFAIEGLDFSPIRGPEGNIEYLLYLRKDGPRSAALKDLEEAEGLHRLHELTEGKQGISDTDTEMAAKIRAAVDAAHEVLDKG
ncbi:MAG: TlyA family RNA methyltransferase [Lachnospiraceae bacterium]|nr:TlyA family RNA methyltransferase [Lachnospiraceae bacterium]